MYLERVAKRHDRGAFDCGVPELNRWLATEARQYEKKKVARTYVLTPDGATVAGYYSLSAHSVIVPEAPNEIRKGLADRHTLPAVLLGRLAIDKSRQGLGLGTRLLAEAIREIVDVAGKIGVRVVVVDAVDDTAAGFYEKYGFVRWPSDSLRLFAKVSDLEALLDVAQ